MNWMNRLTRPLALIAVLVLAACGEAPKVTLKGTIRDAYTNAPIQGAQVVLGSQAGLPTDVNGIWQTQSWAAKDDLVVMASGYQSATLPLRERTDLVKPTSLTMTVDVQLRPSTLSGTVNDTYAKQPLAGAVVEVVGSTPPISATTDSGGRYTLENVPEAFQIVVHAPAHEEQRADIRRSTAQDLALRPNELVGVVKDTYSEQPVADVVVEMGEASAKTDAAGAYKLVNVPDKGQLVFHRDGYDAITQTFTETVKLDATLRPNIIEGLITDATSGQPLSQTLVSAATGAVTNTAVTSTYSDDQGRFVLEERAGRRVSARAAAGLRSRLGPGDQRRPQGWHQAPADCCEVAVYQDRRRGQQKEYQRLL